MIVLFQTDMAKKQRLFPRLRTGNRLRKTLGISALSAIFLAGLFLQKQSLKKAPLRYSFRAEHLAKDLDNSSKLRFVVFNLPHCYPCKVLEEQINQQLRLKNHIRDHFLAYQIDGQDSYTGGKDLAEKYEISEFPSIILTDKEGELLGRIPVNDLLSEDPTAINQVLKNHAMKRISFRREESSKKASGPEAEHGLLYRTASNWSEALELIHFLEKNWREDIWLEPISKKEIRVIVGRYSSKEKAKLTRKFLKLWEGEKTRLVKLNPSKSLMRN